MYFVKHYIIEMLAGSNGLAYYIWLGLVIFPSKCGDMNKYKKNSDNTDVILLQKCSDDVDLHREP